MEIVELKFSLSHSENTFLENFSSRFLLSKYHNIFYYRPFKNKPFDCICVCFFCYFLKIDSIYLKNQKLDASLQK